MATHSQTKIANDQHFDSSYTAEYSVAVTGEDIITPSSGKSIAIKGVYLGTQATSGRVRVYLNADEDGNTNTLAILYAENQAGYIPLLLKGDPDEAVQLDSNITDEWFVLVNYREE